MMNEIKKNELNEQEMENVAGGMHNEYTVWEEIMKDPQVQENIRESEEFFGNAWEVVKHVLGEMF